MLRKKINDRLSVDVVDADDAVDDAGSYSKLKDKIQVVRSGHGSALCCHTLGHGSALCCHTMGHDSALCCHTHTRA